MTSEELRVGNYFDYQGQTVQVLNILSGDKSDFGYFEDSVGFLREYDADDCPKPIKLTEQLFLDLGFIKRDEFFIIGRLDINYCFNYRDFKDDYTFRVEYTDSGDSNDDGKRYPVTFSIKYVHQLQNLMYWVSNGMEQIELKFK